MTKGRLYGRPFVIHPSSFLPVGEFAAQLYLFGGAADEDVEVAGVCAPLLRGGVVVGERAAVEADGDAARLAGLERDLGEALQLLRRARDSGVRVGDVDLRDLGALAL